MAPPNDSASTTYAVLRLGIVFVFTLSRVPSQHCTVQFVYCVCFEQHASHCTAITIATLTYNVYRDRQSRLSFLPPASWVSSGHSNPRHSFRVKVKVKTFRIHLQYTKPLSYLYTDSDCKDYPNQRQMKETALIITV